MYYILYYKCNTTPDSCTGCCHMNTLCFVMQPEKILQDGTPCYASFTGCTIWRHFFWLHNKTGSIQIHMTTSFAGVWSSITHGGLKKRERKTLFYTGKSLSEAFIFASTNPKYDGRLFIELQVQYMKIPSSEHILNMSLQFSCTELVIQ